MKKFLLCAFVLFAACMCWPKLALTLTDEGGRVVYMTPVSLGDRYTVRFIHSVARTPVDEIYEIGEDCSILRETWFDMGGAGLPYNQGDSKQRMTVENGKFHIVGFDLKIPVLVYRINMVVADHTLIIHGRTYKLRNWAAPGKPLTFRVAKRSLGLLLCYRIRDFFSGVYLRIMKEGTQNG